MTQLHFCLFVLTLLCLPYSCFLYISETEISMGYIAFSIIEYNAVSHIDLFLSIFVVRYSL